MREHFDVVVCGSGPAGFSAAYYAARNGADTLLVEKNGSLGGMLTTGHMGVFCGYASCGLYKEICETIGQRLAPGLLGQVAYDIEEMRQFLFAKVEESGMALLLTAFATGVEKRDGSIDRLQVHAKEGMLKLSADVYIDATGDGDVAAFAGEEYSLGREGDGKFQPMSLMFSVAGVDTDRFGNPKDPQKRAALSAKLQEYVHHGDVPYPAGHVILIQGCGKGNIKVNCTNVIDLDGTKSEDLTSAEMQCRKQLAGLVRFLRNEAEGFENCYVAGSGDMIGVRSSRHIKGRYVLNEKDISEGRVFDDWAVSQAKYVWGTHNLYGPIGGDSQEKSRQSPFGRLPHDKLYTIPFRSLRPAKTDNLLLAGRCISGTFLAHSNYRVMPICMAMGQGAGTAAAMAVKTGCRLDDLDIREVQETLVQQGVEPPHAESAGSRASEGI